MNKNKVLLIGRYGHPADVGGVANATKNLVQMTEEITSFHIFSIRDPLLISEELLKTADYGSENINLSIVPTVEGFGTQDNEKFEESTERLADLITKMSSSGNPQLVQVMTAYPNYVRVGEKVSSKFGIPYIVSVRGSDAYGHNPEVKYWHDKTWFLQPLRNASLITVLSDFQEGEVRQNLNEVGFTNIPIKKIRNGVDTNRFAPLDKMSIPDGTIRAVYTGRIRKFKNILDIIKAVHLAQSSINIELDVYGKPEEGHQEAFLELKDYIEQNRLSSLVRANGVYIPHNFLPEIYRRHNLFIHASICEGNSNSVMEAMSCGLAVALNYASGSSDLLDNIHMVFESGNIDSLVKVFDYLAHDPKRLAEHGVRNREFALQHHWKQIAQQYSDIYREMSKK